MMGDFTLNKEQLEAVRHGPGPVLIVAGAGTGKTTVITERIKHLILEKKVSPTKILALTFTEKASQEMETRVDMALPYGYTQLFISTFHSFCDRLLRMEALNVGFNPAFKLLTPAQSVLLLRKNLFSFNLNYFRPLGTPDKFIQGMLDHFSRLKDEDISTDEYLKYSQKLDPSKDEESVEKTKELANAYKKYEELKVKEGVMDFSDLISNTLKLLRTRKNILKSYQDQFEYILVDEFQDTNFAQNELAILLSGERKNITVVGDDDQAIYRWRGAALANIIQFKNHFPQAKIVTLTKNYRSTQEILDISHKVIENNNPNRLEVKEKIDKKLSSERKIKGGKIEFIFRQRAEDEAEAVVNEIENFIKKGLSYKDFAILVRANDNSIPFTRALERSGIPYQFLGPGQLFHKEEIKDLIAYLKTLYDFEDSASMYRVLNNPIFDLDARDIAATLNFARRRNFSLFHALENIDEVFVKNETKEKVKSIEKMIKRHLKLVPKETAGQVLYYFLEDSGLLKKYSEVKVPKEEKTYQNIAKFFDKLKTYEAENEDASIFAVVDWIDLSMQMGESPLAADIDWTQNDAINILTIHSSKGLEFPVVFLVNLVSGRFPTYDRKERIPLDEELIKEDLTEGDHHLEEERRLFYVGMTRARNNLFLTASNYYGEGKRERKISPFVYEALGEQYVKSIEKKPQENVPFQISILDWAPPSASKKTQIIKNGEATQLTYLSYSQLQTFDICPMHYKMRYILRIPTPQTPAQSFGTSIHGALRDFYQHWVMGDEVDIKNVSDFLKNNWITEGYSSKKHEESAFEKAKKLAIEYLDANFKKDKLPLAVEQPFNFLLSGIKIGGRIDRIDQIDKNTIEIIDYKTGKNVPDEKKLAKDLQLTFYALAATEVRDNILNRKPENIILSLVYLEEGKKFSTTRTKEHLENAKIEIIQKAKEISESDFVCRGGSICLTREYKILCSVN
jgi:DNA helicase-2/ATP-dependent DNA helicase PcrA